MTTQTGGYVTDMAYVAERLQSIETVWLDKLIEIGVVGVES